MAIGHMHVCSGIDGTEDEIVMYRMCLPGHECSAHAWPMFMLPW